MASSLNSLATASIARALGQRGAEQVVAGVLLFASKRALASTKMRGMHPLGAVRIPCASLRHQRMRVCSAADAMGACPLIRQNLAPPACARTISSCGSAQRIEKDLRSQKNGCPDSVEWPTGFSRCNQIWQPPTPSAVAGELRTSEPSMTPVC